MHISTKGFYAVEILRALARWNKSLRMTLADIEDTTGIPRPYVESLLLRLNTAGIAVSFRGNAGGYALAKKTATISLKDVFTAVGEGITPWVPLGGGVRDRKTKKRPRVCPLNPVWRELYERNESFFARTTLADFV